MPDPDRTLALCAAYLAGEKRTQVEIARELHIGQATVSRLLAQARAAGLLVEEVRFREEKATAEEMEAVRRRVGGDADEKMRRIAANLGLAVAPKIRVFSSGDGDLDTLRRMRILAGNAAPYLRSLMRSCSSFGATWGEMLHSVLEALTAEGAPAPWSRDGKVIRVLPLMGDPLDQKPAETGSTAIAQRLDSIINGALPRETHSLGMVPMMTPEDFKSPAELNVVKRLCCKVQSYRQIFGFDEAGNSTGGGLVESLDAIFTSVGPAERQFGWAGSPLVKGETLEDLVRRAHGDIGGVVIPKDEFIGDAKLELVARRWNGVRIEHLRRCFDRAAAPGSQAPGVVTICRGKERAEFIYRLLQTKVARPGLINHLVVDQAFAEHFFALADPLTGAASGKKARAAR